MSMNNPGGDGNSELENTPKVHCKYDKLIPSKKLKPHPKNRNIHPPDQIDRLSKIIAYQGIRAPIVVSNLSGYIVKGHGTLEAIRRIKIDSIPVVYQDFESEEQEYAFVQSDNAIASWAELDFSGINTDIGELGPDFDISLLGIKNFEIEVADKDPGCDEDDTPSIPKDVENLMNGEKAALCFTSPPYADQREYNGDKELSTEHLAKFISTAFGHVSYFSVNLGYSRKNGEVNTYWDDYITEAKACGLKLLSWNVWDKGQAGSIGNQTAMFAVSHEWILVFGQVPFKLNLTVENKHSGENANHTSSRGYDGVSKKRKGNIVRSHSQMMTVFMTPPETRGFDVNHPAKFPVELPESYVEAMTNNGDIVYEPFGGSGSTLIACEKTNRKCFMSELDPHYVDVIVSRYCKYTKTNKVIRNGEEIDWSLDG